MGFQKKDFWASVATGVITGFSAWQIAEFLGLAQIANLSFAWLVAIVPVLWIVGVNLGYFLGRVMPFFNQFGKFAAIGFTNAAVDFGILYLLIGISGNASGYFYVGFKTLSFVFAAIHSYLWNKFWVFESGRSQKLSQEMSKFFVITVAAAIINVLAASIVVNALGPKFGLSAEAWAGVGAVIGSATALLFSFVGFRTLVFKK